MKYRNICIFLLICVSNLLFLSCKSTPEKEIDSVYVMVYDFENSEVMNVSVFIDGAEKGKTDIYGRLQFYCDKEKEVLIRAEKNGFETIEINTAIKPGIVIYIKMGSGSYYAQKAERLFDENERNSALRMINKALEIEERKDWRYLQEVIVKEVKKDE